ncbi:MAG: hypothetical protein ABI650_01510 [Dokdonella sp.]
MNRIGYIAVIGLVTCCTSASAQERPTPVTPVAEKVLTQSTAVDTDVKVYVDPESGALVSRAANAQQAEAVGSGQFRQDFSKIEEKRHVDGTIEWVFNGQVDSALKMVKGEDRTLEVLCAEHGERHLHAAANRQGGVDER